MYVKMPVSLSVYFIYFIYSDYFYSASSSPCYSQALTTRHGYCFKVPQAIYSRAVRRRHCVGGGSPVKFGRGDGAPRPRKSAARLAAKIFFQRFPKKFCSILKIF